jgi:hypothetical protein
VIFSTGDIVRAQAWDLWHLREFIVGADNVSVPFSSCAYDSNSQRVVLVTILCGVNVNGRPTYTVVMAEGGICSVYEDHVWSI